MKRQSVKYVSAVALLASLALSGCATSEASGLADQWNAGGDKGYVAGDGSTTSFKPAERVDAVSFEGVTEHGDAFNSDQLKGNVSVVNFWYAGCAPCRAEAPQLHEVYDAFQSQGVKFLGVNVRDQEAQAQQFAEEFKVDYPSILDSVGERKAQRAFAGQVPLNAVPTTLVLDKEGRVAHRIVGQLAAASQLRTLVQETLAEG